jgi:hypothetical protein
MCAMFPAFLYGLFRSLYLFALSPSPCLFFSFFFSCPKKYREHVAHVATPRNSLQAKELRCDMSIA